MKTLNLNKILLLACLFIGAAFFSNNANATCVKVGDVITTESSTTPVTDTEEGAQLDSGFGGLAAVLRYPIM